MTQRHCLSVCAELVRAPFCQLQPVAAALNCRTQAILATCGGADTRASAGDSESAALCSRSHPLASGQETAPRGVRSHHSRPFLGETVERVGPLTPHSRTLLHGRLRSNKGAITRCWRSGGNGAGALSSQAVGEGKQALVRRRPWWSARCRVLVNNCRGSSTGDSREELQF